ncbi:hypothetical protein AB2J22_03635 [Aeromonas sp. A5]|uniref:hypothetical protein n=1 Tax=unclassified Aeromonas TaxID=257493 RepID=UPI00376F9C0B
MHNIKTSNMCPMLKEHEQFHNTHLHDPFCSQVDYYFKCERIISPYGDEQGCEVLLDFKKAHEIIGEYASFQYEKAIYNGSALEVLIEKLIGCYSALQMERLFVNVERSYLCNRPLLQRAVMLAKKLRLSGVELVLEITERNLCGKCPKIMSGLRYLKSFDIALAADDFDIYGNDFRLGEVLSGFYDYIKIEMPSNDVERKMFNDFVLERSSSREKIILEKVEDPTMLNGLFTPFGVQGYGYGESRKMF